MNIIIITYVFFVILNSTHKNFADLSVFPLISNVDSFFSISEKFDHLTV